MKFSKLFKTNLLITLVLFLGFGLVGSVFFFEEYHNTKIRIQHRANIESVKLYSEINPIFVRLISVSSSLASDGFLISFLSTTPSYEKNFEKDIKMFLEGSRKLYDSDAAFLAIVKNRELYSHEGFNRVLGEDEESKWFNDSLVDGKQYIINLDTDKFSKNESSIFVNYKVFDRKNNLIAITGLAIHLDTIKSILIDFKEITNSDAFLVSESGNVIISTDQDKNNIVSHALREHIVKSNCMLDSDNRVISVKPIPELGGFLVIDYPIEDIFEELKPSLYKTGIIFCVILFITLFTITKITCDFENRIITLTVAEVFDSIMFNKPYKKDVFIKNIFDLINEERNMQFNTDLFTRIRNKIRKKHE